MRHTMIASIFAGTQRRFARSGKGRPGLGLLLAVAAASTAHGQWTVTNLHVPGSTGSDAFAASGGQQAGYVEVGFLYHASLWSGTAGTWVDLNPAGASQSVANAIQGGQQAGYALIGGVYRAGLWSGTAGSWADLTPSGLSGAWINAMSVGQQAGYANVGGFNHASVWSGTAGSWVDLHPVGALSSIANAVGGGQQAGYANVGGVLRACLWSGSAATWVDLHPAGASRSFAYAVAGGLQAGSALARGAFRASLWTGSAGSWVDLSPAGTSGSEAYGMNDAYQVGYATVGNFDHASIWSGTAASWVDLGAFVPGEFSHSYAQGISTDGSNLYISGYGFSRLSNRYEALLWTRSLCTAAIIVRQPQNTSTCASGTAEFSVTAGGTGPLTHAWQWKPAPAAAWTNLANGINSYLGQAMLDVTGASDATLRPRVLSGFGNNLRFRCVVTNACGNATSNEASLTVCAADYNCDGFLDFFDYDDFVSCFEGTNCGDGNADFNGDGFVDFFDYDAYVAGFEAGC